jgi:predicted nucleic acid-binding protein
MSIVIPDKLVVSTRLSAMGLMQELALPYFIGQLDLLRQLYQRDVIPDAVSRELAAAGG